MIVCNSYGQSNEATHDQANFKFDQANQKYLAKDYTSAISLYDEAIALEPKNYLFLYDRAIATP